MITVKRPLFIILLLLITGFILTACNTEQAVGNSMSTEIAANSGVNNEVAIQADTAVSAPVTVSSEAIELYATTCSGCHGDNGQGSGIAPPLNSPELRTRLDDTALTMTMTITNGRSGTQMPAWGNTLSAEEINALVTLIRNWDSLDNEQQAQMETQAAECGSPVDMMGSGNGTGGMMGGSSRRGNCP